jgi:two-component system, OmpR family, sensor kinase
MSPKPNENGAARLLATLEGLLAIDEMEMGPALTQVSDILVSAFGADKVDLFLCNDQHDTLVTVGISNTPMSARQAALGLNRLPIAGGGREVETYLTRKPYLTGYLDLDTGALPGFRYDLGALSMILVWMDVNGRRCGLIQIASAIQERFTQEHVRFAETMSHWIGSVAHRDDLVEQARLDRASAA